MEDSTDVLLLKDGKVGENLIMKEHLGWNPNPHMVYNPKSPVLKKRFKSIALTKHSAKWSWNCAQNNEAV